MREDISIKEIKAILKDQQAVLVAMNNQLQRLELAVSEIGKSGDYSDQLHELQRTINDHVVYGGTKALRDTIQTQSMAVDGMIKTIQSQLAYTEQEIPNKIKYGVERAIEGKQKPYIITAIVLFIISLFLVFVAAVGRL